MRSHHDTFGDFQLFAQLVRGEHRYRNAAAGQFGDAFAEKFCDCLVVVVRSAGMAEFKIEFGFGCMGHPSHTECG